MICTTTSVDFCADSCFKDTVHGILLELGTHRSMLEAVSNIRNLYVFTIIIVAADLKNEILL